MKIIEIVGYRGVGKSTFPELLLDKYRHAAVYRPSSHVELVELALRANTACTALFAKAQRHMQCKFYVYPPDQVAYKYIHHYYADMRIYAVSVDNLSDCEAALPQPDFAASIEYIIKFHHCFPPKDGMQIIIAVLKMDVADLSASAIRSIKALQADVGASDILYSYWPREDMSQVVTNVRVLQDDDGARVVPPIDQLIQVVQKEASPVVKASFGVSY